MLAAVSQIFFTAYFAKKRYFGAALVYALASLSLLCVALLSTESVMFSEGLVGLLGYDLYSTLHESTLVLLSYSISPILALQILSVVSAIVVAVRTAEQVVLYVKSSRASLFRKARNPRVSLRFPLLLGEGKKYLSLCVMRC